MTLLEGLRRLLRPCAHKQVPKRSVEATKNGSKLSELDAAQAEILARLAQRPPRLQKQLALMQAELQRMQQQYAQLPRTRRPRSPSALRRAVAQQQQQLADPRSASRAGTSSATALDRLARRRSQQVTGTLRRASLNDASPRSASVPFNAKREQLSPAVAAAVAKTRGAYIPPVLDDALSLQELAQMRREQGQQRLRGASTQHQLPAQQHGGQRGDARPAAGHSTSLGSVPQRGRSSSSSPSGNAAVRPLQRAVGAKQEWNSSTAPSQSTPSPRGRYRSFACCLHSSASAYSDIAVHDCAYSYNTVLY
jgi:hypothetical protein